MKSRNWVTILTISGSVILFGAWLNENYVEKNISERSNIIREYSSKLAYAKIENTIIEIKIWNVRNMFIQDTLDKVLKKTFYDNIIKYNAANVKLEQIGDEATEDLFPANTLDFYVNHLADSLEIHFKAMLDEDSSSSKKMDDLFMKLVANDFFSSTLNPYMFEYMYNLPYNNSILNLAYLFRVWFYIIGSFCLAFAYIIQRRQEI